MIKIEPLFATDYAQVNALLRHQPELEPAQLLCGNTSLVFRGLAFWQHWLPSSWHILPSVYVAREDGVVLGLIALASTGKSKNCWQIEYLIVHPHHRGRGVAQELLRYAFALFGSQGASHFIAEVGDQNPAALALYASCGFRRCAKLTHYDIESPPETIVPQSSTRHFRLATLADKNGLYQLYQDRLPPDIRLVYSYEVGDFAVSDAIFESVDNLKFKPGSARVWYWVLEDPERRVLTCAARVTAHRAGDFHLDFAIHPGWKDQASDLVAYCLYSLKSSKTKSVITAKAFDFDLELVAALEKQGFQRRESSCLLAREHWLRAKQRRNAVKLPNIGKAVINFPLATEFHGKDQTLDFYAFFTLLYF